MRFDVRVWGRMWRAGTVGAALAVLAGCWSMPGAAYNRRAANEVESSITTETVGSLTERWTYTSGHPGSVGSPVWSAAGIHVVAGDEPEPTSPFDLRSLQTVERGTGELLWRSEKAPAGGNPVVVGDTVYWGYGLPNLFGGLWRLRGYDVASGAPGPDLGSVVVDTARARKLGTWDHGIAPDSGCFGAVGVTDLDDPDASWTRPTFAAPEVVRACTPVPPTVGDGTLFHAGLGPLQPASQPTNFGNGIRAVPVAKPAGCTTDLCGWSDLTWATELPGETATSPVIGTDGTTLYTVNDLGTVYAVAAADGSILWSAPLGAAVTDPPALAHGSLFVPTGSGLQVLAADGCGSAECAPVWTAAAGTLRTQPAVAGGVVFTGAVGGAVNAYPAGGCGSSTCVPLWSTTTGSTITGGPVVAVGRLYVGTFDGRLVAYGPADDG